MKEFFSSIPGLITAMGGLIAAVTGLIAILYQVGVIGRQRGGVAGNAIESSTQVGPSGQTNQSQSPEFLQNIAAVQLLVGGCWQAKVTYDWGDTHTEKFEFKIFADELHGTASFLGSPKGILDGKLLNGKITFTTHSEEVTGDWKNPKTRMHRYTGLVRPDRIDFIMATEGGYSSHTPVEFSAHKTLHAP